MSAAAVLPVAAAPQQPRAVSGGGLVPAGGFVPISHGVPGQGAAAQTPGTQVPADQAPAGTPAAGQASAGQVAPGTAAQAPAAEGIDPKAGLAALEERFGEDYGTPLIAANGSVYMESREPDVKDGKIVLRYALVGRIDQQSGKLVLNPAFLDAQKSKKPPGAKLVKVDDSYFWQVMAKGEDGQITARMVPVSQAELQAMAANMQQQEAQTQQEAWNKNRIDWIQKLGEQSSLMKTVGYAGGLVNSLSQGPDPYTGKPQTHWYTGYMVLQMLDARADGKILPQWMKSGPVGTALDWGLQGLFALDIGRDLATLGTAFPRTASLMRAFTAPTRAVLRGVVNIGKGAAAATAPASAAAGAATAGAAAASNLGMAAQAMGATTSAATGAAGAAGASSSAIQGALTGLGKSLRTGGHGLVGAGGLADKAALMSAADNSLSLVPKGAVHAAMKATETPLTGALKVQSAVSNGVMGALSALKPFLRTLQVGGSIFGAVAGALNIGYTIKNGGYKSLVTTQQGRGAVSNFVASSAFLGMLALPVLAGPLGIGAGALSVGYAALNVASNVFSGISMLNYAGLFGDGGWLDHDGVRAAFLIPPLTPVGLYAMWMKRRKRDEEAKAKQLEQAKQTMQQTVASIRKQSAGQLQEAGSVSGAVQQDDGSLIVPTQLPNDLRELAGQKQAELPDGIDRTLQLISRPMRGMR